MKWKEWLMATPIYDLMGKRSYAQSGEDLIAAIELSGREQKIRAGASPAPTDKGYYVDIGAYHPKVFSNTYLFYKKGWRGICVEPNPEMESLHKLVRSRDVFVNCGVGKEKGKMEYFLFEDGAANTFSSDQAEKSQKEAGRRLLGTKKIKIRSLKEILDEYMPKGQDIDLLSVDVEGMDEEVLRSNDWKKYRPRVIICEDLEFDFNRYYLMDSRLRGNDKGVAGILGGQGYRLVAKTPYSLIFKI